VHVGVASMHECMAGVAARPTQVDCRMHGHVSAQHIVLLAAADGDVHQLQGVPSAVTSCAHVFCSFTVIENSKSER